MKTIGIYKIYWNFKISKKCEKKSFVWTTKIWIISKLMLAKYKII